MDALFATNKSTDPADTHVYQTVYHIHQSVMSNKMLIKILAGTEYFNGCPVIQSNFYPV